MVDRVISKAIKEEKWAAIEYENQKNEITKYWIAIKDVDFNTRSFSVYAYNFSKMDQDSNGIIETKIYFDNIKEARLLEHTTYNQPENLVQKIYTNIDQLSWLGYDTYNDNILDYIKDCMKQEEVSYQQETTLLRGIDEDILNQVPIEQKYSLSFEQVSDLVPKIEKLAKQDEKRKYESVTLALNLLSIVTKRGLFIVAYKELNFNPIEKSLMLGKETLFNYEFLSLEFNNFKHNLRHYLDIETDDFTKLFVDNQVKAKDMLSVEIKKYAEELDDRPYIFDLRKSYYAYIDKEFNQIKEFKKNNQLSIPLEAFFGNAESSRLKKRKRGVDVVVLNDQVNMDQLRVIHNALIQPITYVQGPPGTGKTQTIINTLISAFFNGQTVLVASNNNKPISDIYQKLHHIKYKEKQIPLPILRLGNNQEILNSLNNLKDLLPKIKNYRSDEEKLNSHADNKKKKMKTINEMLQNYEARLELVEEIDALETMLNQVDTGFNVNIIINVMLIEKKSILNKLPNVSDDDIKGLITKVDYAFLTWLFFTSIKNIKRLFEPKNEKLLNIINSNNDEEKVKAFNHYTQDEKNFKNIQKIFPIILTTNQSAHRLGSPGNLFDLVILDEAGQCSIGNALFPIARGERLLLVGDQNQLKPVISIAPETNRSLIKKYQVPSAYHYLENSILLSMQKMDTISKYVLLSYHYRSRKDIINFSNKKYYHGQLKIKLDDVLDSSALDYINIDSSKSSKNQEKNVSMQEAIAIVDSIKNHEGLNIGIITPFRNQVEVIKGVLNDEKMDNIDVGTIHTFQGDEKDMIYLSGCVTKNTHNKTFDWLKNNQELINVATTRAKKKFVLVGDFNEIKKRSEVTNDFFELVEYVKKKGKEVSLTESTKTKFINSANFRSYNTKKEKEFFETINHIMSLGTKYIVENKVRVASILDRYTTPQKYDYGLKAEFDMVIFIKRNQSETPILVIEVDGDEHVTDKVVIARDKLKEQICKDNGLKIIRIPNDYSRRYVFIKDVLLKLLK